MTDLLHRRHADIGDAGHHRPFTAQTLLPGDVNLREYYTCEYVLHVLANADLWHIAAVYLKTCPNQEARGHPLLGTILTRIASRPEFHERRVRKVVEVAEAAGLVDVVEEGALHAARTGGRRDELGWHFSGCTVLVQSALHRHACTGYSERGDSEEIDAIIDSISGSHRGEDEKDDMLRFLVEYREVQLVITDANLMARSGSDGSEQLQFLREEIGRRAVAILKAGTILSFPTFSCGSWRRRLSPS